LLKDTILAKGCEFADEIILMQAQEFLNKRVPATSCDESIEK